MKYPIGIQSFDQIIEDGYVYVDKTGLVYRLDRLETEWAEYPVFHIDFNGTNFTESGKLEDIIEGTVSTWEKVYGRTTEFKDMGKRFAYVLQQAHRQHGRRCVVLIDEYDKPILDVLDTGYSMRIDGRERLLEDWHREILKGFYSVFKSADEDLQFVLLTGVTKFSQVSGFSGFNQPSDISMDEQYETLCGITQEELEHYFAGPIEALAEKYRTTPEGMKMMLKHRYDGYHFSSNLTDVYNPFSLLNAFAKRELRDYWFSSGTPTYLIRLMNHTQEDLNELTGRYYRPEEFVDYKADVEQPLPMIYQSGYLTVKDCDMEFGTFLLDFPNNEVKNGFVSLVASNYLKPEENLNGWIRDVVRALRQGDTESLRGLFTSFLAGIPYTMRSKHEKERYFHYTFYLIFRLISVYTVYTEKEQSQGSVYTVYTEKEQSQGRSDCIVETPDYVYIFEFKRDGSADEALAQIEAKGYARPYEADPRTIYKIGVNFSSETGRVEEWKNVRMLNRTL